MSDHRDKFRLILASRSPRRRQLLAELGIGFEIVAPRIAEPMTSPVRLPPAELAEAWAYFKAACVYTDHTDDFVLGADTLVSLDGRVFGKPADAHEARHMLEALSGSRHEVITGVALLGPGLRRLIASATTKITMRPMSRREIDGYIATGEWQDKAGAYAIQETADRYVEKIEGSFTNVVGLPLELTERMINQVRRQGPCSQHLCMREQE